MPHDDPLFSRWKPSDFTRLDAHIDRSSPEGHWLYSGPRNGIVPSFSVYLPRTDDAPADNLFLPVRRITWALAHGSPTDAPFYMYQNTCGVSACVNPDHTRLIEYRKKPGRKPGTQGRQAPPRADTTRRPIKVRDLPRWCEHGHDTLILGRTPAYGHCRACRREGISTRAAASRQRPEDEDAWIEAAEEYLRSV